MERTQNYDIFITHAWRFHDDWVKFSDLMNTIPSFAWRNFSLPWHDPAVSPNTEVGGRFIREFLESQIMPAHVVILLVGVFEIRSARRCVDMEVEMAKKHNKPIIGIPAINKEIVPPEVSEVCDAISGWDGEQLVVSMREVQALPKFSTTTGLR